MRWKCASLFTCITATRRCKIYEALYNTGKDGESFELLCVFFNINRAN